MKKITLLFVGILAASFTFASGKNDNPVAASGMAVLSSSTSLYKLIYKSEEASDVRVEIFDGNDQRIFSEVIKRSSGFVRPYNFNNLPEGEYTIKIDNGANWLTETVEYRPSEINKQAHVVSLKDGKYLLSLVGPEESMESFEIGIFDTNGAKVYSETKAVSGNFVTLFNLKELNGPFSFQITGKTGASKTLVK